MRWVTRAGVHIDRAGSAGLIRRFIDPDATFAFVTDPAEIPAEAMPFDMRGVELLNLPGAGGAGQRSDQGSHTGSEPEPGGWNRFQLLTNDLDDELQRLRTAGAAVRTSIVEGRGRRQAVLDDPSGNLIELFEPTP